MRSQPSGSGSASLHCAQIADVAVLMSPTPMPTEESLPELLARVAFRDRRAFERLYRATCAHLFSVSLRILRNEGRADEVLQEAYVSIWHNAAGYNAAAGTPMTWMINIVRNKSIDVLRAHRSELAATTEIGDEAMNVAADSAAEPQRLLEDSLIKAKINDCMRALSSAQRQALALAYYRGMVHTEIASALNAPLGTAKGWVRRGLDQLKSCLEGAGVTGL
jgi:RNA polymerase sigma-70 factor (ECF subfamily)